MRFPRSIALGLGFLLALSACSGGSDPVATTAAHKNLEGTWSGTVKVLTGTALPLGSRTTVVLVLSQSWSDPTKLTGTITIPGYLPATITGTAANHQWLFAAEEPDPCAATFHAEGTASDPYLAIEGIYTGTDCHGSLGVEFSATRQ